MYTLYQSEILKAVQNSKLHHLSEMHSANSKGEALCTDYFYTPEKKSRCLVHISGVHGVEGYLGSLIQRELLKWKWTREEAGRLPFQVVIVHAVNPWGMENFQRGNPANVDLNRNSLKEYRIENPHFSKFEPFFQKGHAKELIKLLPTMFKLGVAQTVQTVACGQTEFPKSLFFAGHEMQPELKSLRENLQKMTSPEAEMFFIDVHTGLGKRKQESLILDGFETSAVTAKEPEETFFRRVFGSDMISPGRDPGYYRADGVLTLMAKDTWGRDKVRYVIQEFGTAAFYKVLNALISKDPAKMQTAFFPDDSDWRSSCVKLGLLRFMQMMENLESK
jgi:hypothetical protein